MLTLNKVLKEYLEIDDDDIKEVIRLLREDWLQTLEAERAKSTEELIDAMMGR